MLLATFILFVGVPFGALGLLHAKRQEWWMKVKRLIGGVFLAAALATAMVYGQKVVAVMISCGYWYTWPFC